MKLTAERAGFLTRTTSPAALHWHFRLHGEPPVDLVSRWNHRVSEGSPLLTETAAVRMDAGALSVRYCVCAAECSGGVQIWSWISRVDRINVLAVMQQSTEPHHLTHGSVVVRVSERYRAGNHGTARGDVRSFNMNRSSSVRTIGHRRVQSWQMKALQKLRSILYAALD